MTILRNSIFEGIASLFLKTKVSITLRVGGGLLRDDLLLIMFVGGSRLQN